jgi:type VI secretion system protein VasG
MKAFDLALGNIFGSNSFNMILLVPLDLVHPGALLASVSQTHILTALAAIMATAVAVLGQLYKIEKRIRFIEPDAALTRRFQPVPIEEPDDDTAIDMLRMLAPRFGAHHQVLISDAALQAAVRLSRRFLPSRQLPDKAISVLDTACARVSMSQVCAPAELDRIQYRIQTLEQQVHWQRSDARLGLSAAAGDAQERIALETERKQQVATEVDAQREAVRAWVQRLESAEPLTDAPNTPHWDNSAQQACWVRPWVDANSIAEVLSEWTGVPCNEMGKDQAQRLSGLDVLLKERIHGQDAALASIAQALKVAHAGLGDPNRPLGVMLLAGPTGTGKSQTAQALAGRLRRPSGGCWV